MQPDMEFTPASSNVAEIGYDADAEELWVRFNDSGYYVYTGVPSVVWEDFRAADSKGKFVNEVLKPAYPCHRM